MTRPSGFSLVELLVVVTLIVVLLALLAPALDKAIYAAELATDGAGLKAAGGAVVLYAMDHKRHYPYRPGVAAGGWRPNQYTNTYTDERDIYDGYIIINAMLNCPLTATVDMQTSDITWIWGPRMLWFGWRYTNPSHAGMNRMGDRLTWSRDEDGDGAAETYRFNVLISEEDQLNHPSADNWSIASHPDKDGTMSQQVMQDGGGYAQNVPPDIGRYANNNWTLSRWVGPWARGPLDLHHAYDDGSVLLMRDIEHERDERVVLVPMMSDNSQPPWENNLPRP